MIQVRKNVFETNSSSTHTMVMCIDSDYDKWVKGKVYYCSWFPYKADKSLEKESNFYTEEEARAVCESAGIPFDPIEEDDYNERTDHFMTYDEFCDTEYLEVDESKYVTPAGETIHAVCKFGYDG